MSEIVNIFRIDPTNIGDFYSTPIHYFDWLSKVQAYDVEATDYDKYNDQFKRSNVIVGGGGILKFAQLDALFDIRPKNIIAWGVGHNSKDLSRAVMDARLKDFNLVGIRDYGTEYTWVPCVSCMHPAFDMVLREPTNEVVVFEHKNRPLNIKGIPTISNREMQIDIVLAFLGSANTVITNSYHGAYWATLLKKKVVVVEPWSSKFYALKHAPVFAKVKDWELASQGARVYENALTECREANLKFSQTVMNIVMS